MRSILLIEDNPSDARLIREALRWNQVEDDITTIQDGEEALQALEAANRGERTMPHLVLLDLNMPKVDGFTVLRAIRSQPHWSHIPVVVLSSSSWERDIRMSLELGATLYRQKPNDLPGLMALGGELSSMLNLSRADLQTAEA